MHSFTSSSSPSGYTTTIAWRVFVLTLVLLTMYWAFLRSTHPDVRFAETDFNAGLIRLQRLQEMRGPTAFIAGTSISAKLQADVIFDGFEGEIVNMGIDGAPPLFAARMILESQTHPAIVILETNFILSPLDANTQMLDDTSGTTFFKASSSFSPLRREYRPVTLMYSRLKIMRDGLLSSPGARGDLENLRVSVDYPRTRQVARPNQRALAEAWGDVIGRFKERGSSIVMMMIPDGDHDRAAEYRFARNLAATHGLPFVDLKEQLKGRHIIYSDGLHFIESSAHDVARLMNQVVKVRRPDAPLALRSHPHVPAMPSTTDLH